MVKKAGFTLVYFFIFCVVSIGQNLLDEKINFTIQNETIPNALFSLSDSSDVNIAFTKTIFDESKRISYLFKNKSLRGILKYILRDTRVGFKQRGKSILLYELPKKKHLISGYLTDSETGEQLIGAHIIESNSKIGETTNVYGFFSLTLPQGIAKLEFSYLGYQTHFEEINLRSSRKKSIALNPALTLTEIVVSTNAKNENSSEELRQKNANHKLLQQLPTPGGEGDLFRQLQYLPGVQTGADGFGGLHIRGGNADQNLILLDDVPIYNPSHSFGLFSIFNPDIVRSAQFWKGGFPAHYGGRLSSVLDVRTREGNNQSVGAEASTGFLATKLTLEGPLRKNKGAFLLAARRTHQDEFIKKLSRNNKEEEGKMGETAYHFIDITAKFNYAIGKNDRLYLSFYNGGDSFRDTTSQRVEKLDDNFSLEGLNYDYKWGNRVISLRWNHLYGARLFSNVTLISSKFDYESKINTNSAFFQLEKLSFETFRVARFKSVIEDKAIRVDFDYFQNEKQHIRFGGNFHNRTFSPGIFAINETLNSIDSMAVFIQPSIKDTSFVNTSELAAYLEIERTIKDWQCNIGLHNSIFFANGKAFFSLEPRLNFTRKCGKGFFINASITNVSQNLHLLTTSDAGLPNDLWVPATRNAKPQQGWIFTTGINWSVKPNWMIGFDLYYKKMNGLLEFKESTILNETTQNIDARNWEEFAISGEGKSYGLEYSLEKQDGRFRGLLAYTLAWSKRSFTSNQFRSSRFDSRHNLSIALNYQINRSMYWTMSWSFQSGLPLNGFQDNLPFLEIFPHESKIIESNRMPSYHRLDAGFNYEFGQKKWKHLLSIGVYNLYNQSNSFLAYPNEESGSANNWTLVRALPILPSIKYSVKFKKK